MVLTEDVEVEERESLVYQRCENDEVSREKWNEKEKNCCVPCQVISATDDGKRLSSDFFSKQKLTCSWHCLRAIFLEGDGVPDGVLPQAGLVAAGLVGYM